MKHRSTSNELTICLPVFVLPYHSHISVESPVWFHSVVCIGQHQILTCCGRKKHPRRWPLGLLSIDHVCSVAHGVDARAKNSDITSPHPHFRFVLHRIHAGRVRYNMFPFFALCRHSVNGSRSNKCFRLHRVRKHIRCIYTYIWTILLPFCWCGAHHLRLGSNIRTLANTHSTIPHAFCELEWKRWISSREVAKTT